MRETRYTSTETTVVYSLFGIGCLALISVNYRPNLVFTALLNRSNPGLPSSHGYMCIEICCMT